MWTRADWQDSRPYSLPLLTKPEVEAMLRSIDHIWWNYEGRGIFDA